MLKVAAYLVAGLVVGFGVAVIGGRSFDDGSERPTVDTIPLERRLSQLETALAFERRERETLERELDDLVVTLTDLRADSGSDPAAEQESDGPPGVGALADVPIDARESGDVGPAQRFGRRLRGGESDEDRIERFIAAGISPERAQWIIQRQSELQLELLQARYEAARGGEPIGPGAVRNVDDALRAELGDVDYERYLEAQGRPTRVGVFNVMASSPAEAAGFAPGDEIVAYAGQRVFDLQELNQLTYEGRPGESVVVDVVRDGQQIQLYLPRGPLGITGGGNAINLRGRLRGRP